MFVSDPLVQMGRGERDIFCSQICLGLDPGLPYCATDLGKDHFIVTGVGETDQGGEFVGNYIHVFIYREDSNTSTTEIKDNPTEL